ncbi:MAG: Holliday junction branch migration protein RuvA [Halieaceae bacterium]|nr:Holliday junction branch migration protein RuvA [Halieaceae bacterium]MCP4467683.1 Holliday junction branch migration protein RuvA [Halieaceae bacterium]MCP4842479.1 Holliday junction branch migration protein RuvA [Halieaceae bacterium]
MIGSIRGVLVQKQAPLILVDVAGVGYELQVPMTTLFQLPELGCEVSLVTHFVVREDAQALYGFVEEGDRSLFRQLIKVNGVGPKLALTILSGMDAKRFAYCVERDDLSSLTALPGVGKKTAQRLLVEMRDKLKDWFAGGGALSDADAAVVPVNVAGDAESALIALGYKPQDAGRMVEAVNDDDIADSEELIRRALKAAVKA